MTLTHKIIDNLDVPESIHSNWQIIIDLLADLSRMPAVLVMRVRSQDVEVLVVSENAGKAYRQGELLPLGSGLLCGAVIEKQAEVLIHNVQAQQDDINNDVRAGMVSYLGLPLTWPSGEVFGALCVLDIKENKFPDATKGLIYRFRDSVEKGIEYLFEHNNLKEDHHRVKAQSDVVAEKYSKAQQALVEKELELDAVIEHLPNMIFIKEAKELKFVRFNKAGEALLGLSRNDMIGCSDYDLFPKDQADFFIEKDRKVLSSGELEVIEQEPIQTPKGTRILRTKKVAINDKNGKPLYLLGVSEDITDLKSAEELLKHQATYDSLTDLPNRSLVVDRLTQLISNYKRHGRLGAAMFIDLDNFKHINDSLGHHVGDMLLREVAERIKTYVREEDTVGRLGGDEFLVLLGELSSEQKLAAQQALMGANHIKEKISKPYTVEGHSLHVTASIGIAVFPEESETPFDILKHADTAMYKSKNSGRNAVSFYQQTMQSEVCERLELQNLMQAALTENQFSLHYQPQMGLDGQLVGAEVLLRWCHPIKGMIPPDKFISVSEETGQILEIGSWVLYTACKQLKAWQKNKSAKQIQRLAINISPLQFHQANFVDRVGLIVQDVGVDPNRITLEVTEGVFLGHLEGAIEKMNQLKRMGFRFSIDDFGTGYSSLSYLKNLPVDEIKIDREFIRDIMTDSSDAKLVETIITMAKHLDIEVVAEGVETSDQLGFLKSNACQFYQGYFYSKPVEPDTFYNQFLID